MDELRLRELFDRYYKECYRVAYVLTRSAADADDVTQEAFIRAHRYGHTLQPGRPVWPWLRSIVVNTALTHMNRGKTLRGLLELVWRQDGVLRRPPVLSSEREENWDLYAAVQKLPEKLRVTVLLAYYIGLTHEEAAQTLQIPLGTVKSRCNLALHKLREQLGPRYRIETALVEGVLP